MKKTRFTETQIVGILKQQEGGIPTKELCREHGISAATFYNWKSKYGGMEASDVKRMKELEEENAKLKRMYANLALDNEILKDLFAKKAGPCHKKTIHRRANGGTRYLREQGLPDCILTAIPVLLHQQKGRHSNHKRVGGLGL
jgi:putative transposase